MASQSPFSADPPFLPLQWYHVTHLQWRPFPFSSAPFQLPLSPSRRAVFPLFFRRRHPTSNRGAANSFWGQNISSLRGGALYWLFPPKPRRFHIFRHLSFFFPFSTFLRPFFPFCGHPAICCIISRPATSRSFDFFSGRTIYKRPSNLARFGFCHYPKNAIKSDQQSNIRQKGH
jgi:hypothetical protein